MVYWIWLTLLPFIGPVTAKRLWKQFGDAETIYRMNPDEFQTMAGFSVRQKESLLKNRSLAKAENILRECERKGISIMNLNDPAYPGRAKEPEDAPVVLYYKGCLKRMSKTVGIVGARRCGQEAKRKAVLLSEEYTKNGFAIISGMAKGIDSYAQTACLKMGGYTVAVAGNGLDVCYPSEHRVLMERIEEKGLLISEYPPGTLPTRYSFPRRNRLISAWSDQLMIIEPGKGSGTLTTMQYEIKYGRKVTVYG